VREIYATLQNGQPHLAAMGIRSLLERIMISKVRDQHTFTNNLQAFHDKGFVSSVQKQQLETILEAGHATVHRSFTPSEDDVLTLIDIAESIVESVYLHGAKVAALRKRVPKRSRRKKKPILPISGSTK